jgi:AAA15 family ATPase/GTPase
MAEASAWLTSITVENVRCFREAQTLRLVDRDGRPAMWTVILGENASGKTTLLQVAVLGELRRALG